MIRWLFFFNFLILSFSLQAQYQTLDLTFIDSSLCLGLMDQSLKKKIINIESLLKKDGIDCATLMLEDPRPYHAQFVIEAFLGQLNANIQINLTHYNVFSINGQQDLALWKKAINKENLSEAQVLLMTTGGLLEDLFREFPASFVQRDWITPAFISSGQLGPGINQKTKIWPHEYVDRDHPFIRLIGAHEGQMLYREKISQFDSSGKDRDTVRGSSRAAALAAAKEINSCSPKEDFKACLSRKPD